MNTLERSTTEFINLVAQSIETGKAITPELEGKYNTLISMLNQSLDNLISDVQKDEIGNRMGLLQTRLLLEFKDIIECVHRIPVLYQELEAMPSDKSAAIPDQFK